MPDEDTSFSVVDKRGTPSASEDTPDGPLDEVPETDAMPDVGQEQGTEAPEPETQSDDAPHPRLAARDRILMCIDILHQGAWISLGLVADPVTGTVEKDLADARALIDCVAHLAEQAERFVDPSMQTELRNLVSTLRMNFINQSSR